MNQTLADTAARIVAESGIDLSGKSRPVSMMPLLQVMIAETGVARDTAIFHLAVAIRNARMAAKPTPPPMIDDHTPAEQFDA